MSHNYLILMRYVIKIKRVNYEKSMLKKIVFFIDDNKDDIRKEKSDEDALDATLESTNNSQSFQYPVNNDENWDLKKSSRSIVIANQVDEHDDS